MNSKEGNYLLIMSILCITHSVARQKQGDIESGSIHKKTCFSCKLVHFYRAKMTNDERVEFEKDEHQEMKNDNLRSYDRRRKKKKRR